jgi:hypothetical protein
MINEQKKAEEMYQQLIKNAQEDVEFKNQLIANPIETMESFLGGKVEVSDGKTLVVLDEIDAYKKQPNSSEKYLIIPNNREELTAEELEIVAGGGSNSCVCLGAEKVEVSLNVSTSSGVSAGIKWVF